jgi:hypothetical protein
MQPKLGLRRHMSMPAKARSAVAFTALLLGACASQSGGLAPVASTVGPSPVSQTPAGQTVSRLPSGVGYTLSNDELALDCKKLTGRMAVRIVQIRDFQTRTQTTALSRGLQTAVKPAFGGSGEGSDPNGRYARDRAQLEAYNRRLAEKNCANFDLAAELDPSAKEPPRTRPLNRS